jgi:uncharacterized protein (TIGR01319 family)
MNSESVKESYLIVDINNSLTKAVLIEGAGGAYGVRGIGEASTTVDTPTLDVTIGVKNSLEDLGHAVGEKPLSLEGPSKGHRFLCSSSTSGGLYMMVAGVASKISTESAQRAALGAGALLMDVFSKDDPRPPYVIVERMRSTKPDIFLLAGGTDGGAVGQVLDMAHLINDADVRPRFGPDYKLPVVYAGNVEIRDEVKGTLSDDRFATRAVDNVRPVVERENLGPAKEAIYDSYMEHVIVHSPGYDKLLGWVDAPVIPSQAAIGKILYAYAEKRRVNMLAVDVGGETTDVYSVYNGVFNRSLNADVGLIFGICNVMREAGVKSVMRWLPDGMGEGEVRNIIGNIMIRQPGSLTSEEAFVQHAVAREAMRMGVEQHKGIASRLKGVRITRDISNVFSQALESTYLDMMSTRVIIGRGKVFTQSPPAEAALLLLDALQPEGVAEMMIDRLGMMPHLGALLEMNPEASMQILSEKCLHVMGTCVAPRGRAKSGKVAMSVRLDKSDSVIEDVVSCGELKTLPLGVGETAKLEVTPERRYDVGRGRGKRLNVEVTGGDMGLIIDARGRPLEITNGNRMVEWRKALGLGQAPR